MAHDHRAGGRPRAADAVVQIVQHLEDMKRLLAQAATRAPLDPVILLLQEAHERIADQAAMSVVESVGGICLGGLAGWQSRAVARYIEDHLSERPAIRDLARSVGLSAGHFARAFRQTFRMTPMQYVRRIRLERATRMIHDSDMPLRDIATTCGYSDQAHLNRHFRRAMAVSPRRWRHMTDRAPW